MNIKSTIYVLSNVSLHAIQSAFQTQVSDSSLFVPVCVKAAAVFMCQQGLKLTNAPALHTMCDCAPLLFVSGHVEAELSHKESSQHKGQINIASSDSEVEIVGVQEKAR